MLVASALTNLHPGAGRAPGSVDLPVARDSLGIPVVWGTMVKGAFKTMMALKKKCLTGISRGDRREYVVNCGDANCRLLCCLLGGEPGRGAAGASAVSIQDFYPILLPAPAHAVASNDSAPPCNLGGVVYVTTRALLARALAYAEASYEDLAELFGKLMRAGGEKPERAVLYCKDANADTNVRLVLAGSVVVATTAKTPTLNSENLDSMLGLNELNPLYKAYPISERLLVLDDEVGRSVIERLLVRVSRVALDRETKTVRGGHLWTEEYLPWGTLLLGLAFETGYRNDYCRDSSEGFDPLRNLAGLLDELGSAVNIGGKESIGAGLIKIKTLIAGGRSSHDKP